MRVAIRRVRGLRVRGPRALGLRVQGLLAALLMAAPALAQFGHPLKGTWSGDWGPAKDNRTHVVLEMNWDGKAITGNINPGPKAIAMQKATLDPSTWGVHIEGDGKDAAGKPVHYVIDGKLENIGAYQRVLSGTWMEGGKKGDFKVVRN
jgi:hypothetical protein